VLTIGRHRDDDAVEARHCEERSDEAIHFFHGESMDCFAALAMTA
jgi:hypothetical protein